MLSPWKKSLTNLVCILKNSHITLPTKVRLVKAMVFPVVMYGCECWIIKKAECERTGAFELQCWRKLLSPLDCKEIHSVHLKGNQSWILIRRTDAEAEALIFWPPDVKNWLTWKDPDAGKDWRQEEKGNDRGWVGWMASPTWWTWVGVNSGCWWWTEKPGVLQSMGSWRVGHDWAAEPIGIHSFTALIRDRLVYVHFHKVVLPQLSLVPVVFVRSSMLKWKREREGNLGSDFVILFSFSANILTLYNCISKMAC